MFLHEKLKLRLVDGNLLLQLSEGISKNFLVSFEHDGKKLWCMHFPLLYQSEGPWAVVFEGFLVVVAVNISLQEQRHYT